MSLTGLEPAFPRFSPMFSTYDRGGVSFAYPESWRLEEENDGESRLQLTLSSPDTAFWTVVQYGEPLDPADVALQALDALRQEYPDLESEAAESELGPHRLTGYDINFICLDLTSTTKIRAWKHADATWLVFCQAEDREMEQVDPVFRAITASLLSDGPLPEPG